MFFDGDVAEFAVLETADLVTVREVHHYAQRWVASVEGKSFTRAFRLSPRVVSDEAIVAERVDGVERGGREHVGAEIEDVFVRAG